MVGYGTQTKQEITSSVTSIKEEDFNQGNVNDPAQLLQGKVPGLNVVKDNGGDDKQQINEPEEPKLSANTFGGGFVFSPTPKWDITFGGLYVNYKDVTGVSDDPALLFGVPVGYDKKVWNLSAGVTWKFF